MVTDDDECSIIPLYCSAKFECNARNELAIFVIDSNRSSIFKWAEWKWGICKMCNLFWIGNRSNDVFAASGRRQFLIEFRRTDEMRLISIIWWQCTHFSMIDGPKMCVCREGNRPTARPLITAEHWPSKLTNRCHQSFDQFAAMSF